MSRLWSWCTHGVKAGLWEQWLSFFPTFRMRLCSHHGSRGGNGFLTASMGNLYPHCLGKSTHFCAFPWWGDPTKTRKKSGFLDWFSALLSWKSCCTKTSWTKVLLWYLKRGNLSMLILFVLHLYVSIYLMWKVHALTLPMACPFHFKPYLGIKGNSSGSVRFFILNHFSGSFRFRYNITLECDALVRKWSCSLKTFPPIFQGFFEINNVLTWFLMSDSWKLHYTKLDSSKPPTGFF